MLVVNQGTQLKIFMVETPQGPKPRFFKGQDRLQKDKSNALGFKDAKVTTVAESMFLVDIAGRDHTVYMVDIDLPGFIDV